MWIIIYSTQFIPLNGYINNKLKRMNKESWAYPRTSELRDWFAITILSSVSTGKKPLDINKAKNTSPSNSVKKFRQYQENTIN